jgi:thymidylate synthase
MHDSVLHSHVPGADFEWMYRNYRRELLATNQRVDVGSWHSQDLSGNHLLVTREVPWASFVLEVPLTQEELVKEIKPNMPWAETHFEERVSGYPLNPPPSHELWPWSHGQHQAEMSEKFSHTYPERMWPKFANEGQTRPNGRQVFTPHNGIRFEYGDVDDLIHLLVEEPYTRQAYLPIFFPEDTGGSTRLHERIPCSLGYHFLIRDNSQGKPVMDCGYTMRSCDFVRHFRDDIYMAARLLQYMSLRVSLARKIGRWDTMPRFLRVNISSLHMMEGDKFKLETEERNDNGQRQEFGVIEN